MKLNDNTLLKKFVIKNVWQFIVVFVLTLISGYSIMLSAVYIQHITDNLNNKILSGLIMLVSIGFLLQLLFYITRLSIAIICTYLKEKLAVETRVSLVNHLNKIPFSSFEKYSSGDLQSILRNDVDIATSIIYSVFSRILGNIFVLLFPYGIC